MHDCEEFRERITEHIIDRVDISATAEFHHELLMCSSCSEFCAESREMMEALSEIDLTMSDSQWRGIQQRLQAQIRNFNPGLAPALHQEKQDRSVSRKLARGPKRRPRIRIPVWISAVALLLVTIGLSRIAITVIDDSAPVDPGAAIYVEHMVPLDPVTVDFLKASELLLRDVMNMQTADLEDLADARKIAGKQLAELEQRKEAAAEVRPVVGVMETYETILRDLRNVDEQSADEDISDIQTRIRRNGLIANIKAFQPTITQIRFDQE